MRGSRVTCSTGACFRLIFIYIPTVRRRYSTPCFSRRTAAPPPSLRPLPVNIARAHAFTYIRKLQFGKRPLLNSNLREFAVKLRPDIILNHRLSPVYRSRALYFERIPEQCNKLNSRYTCVSFTFAALPPRVKLAFLLLPSITIDLICVNCVAIILDSCI